MAVQNGIACRKEYSCCPVKFILKSSLLLPFYRDIDLDYFVETLIFKCSTKGSFPISQVSMIGPPAQVHHLEIGVE